MILDGYERMIRVHGSPVFYRPATQGERDQFRWKVRKFPEPAAMWMTRQWVRGHIVLADHDCDTMDDDGFERLFKAINGTIKDSSGSTWVEDERLWEINLRQGVALIRDFPEIANRPCEMCRKWWFKADGTIVLSGSGEKMLRQGPTPCDAGVGSSCPKNHWSNQRGLNRANQWSYRHYLECLAVGSFPEDLLVRKNAAIIKKALEKKGKAV